MKVSSSITEKTAHAIRELEQTLKGGHAHVSFEKAVKNIPHTLLGLVPEGLPYSIWQLVEHIRITQWDILEFCRDAGHKSPDWPDGYWPEAMAPEKAGDLERSVQRTLADRQAFIDLLHQSGEELYTPFPYGDGQSLFREAILIIDHTSYHTGEILILRRLLGDWK